MTRLFRLLLLVGLCLPALPVSAAGESRWTARLEPGDARQGEYAQVVVEGEIQEPWHVYGLNKKTDASGFGPRETTLELGESPALEAAGKPVQPAPHVEIDPGFKIEVEYYPKAVAFGLPVRVKEGVAGPQKVVVRFGFQLCKEGTCLRPEVLELPLSFTPGEGAPRPEYAAVRADPPAQPAGYEPPAGEGPRAGPEGAPDSAPGAGAAAGSITTQVDDAKRRGVLAFIGFAILAGFAALLTPCVFPMVPITVSYFAKQQEKSPSGGLKGALAYCLGIVGTFTVLGLALSAFLGAGFIQGVAAHPVTNLLLGILFLVMAANLLGVFEIQLPGWLVEKTSAGGQKGGVLGPIMMGLTFTLTSFTCTAAFVGTLLASAAQGEWTWPLLGMVSFSTAFASPFFFLALFPGWLARLPKSGGWLVTVKAYLGFLEIAAAVKFFSNAELVWRLGLLPRPTFLAIWFAIFTLAAAYMLGWIRLAHDPGSPVGPIRRGFGVATAGLAVVMLAAMNGMSLGYAAGFLPPRIYPGQEVHGERVAWIENYDQALTRARTEGKPLFLDFTGVTCTNCRTMEDDVFSHPKVEESFQRFVTARLYTDTNTPEAQRYARMQVERFEQNTLPLYVVLSPDGNRKLGEYAFDTNVDRFLAFLDSAYSRASDSSVAAAR